MSNHDVFTTINIDLLNSAFENDLFWVQEFVFLNFDLKEDYKKEFEDNNENLATD